MGYILNTPDDQQAMLEAIGVASLDELFAQIPSELRLKRELKIAPALSEIELAAHMGELAAKNVAAGEKVCFLGGGCYDHFVPAVVDYVASRGEFYTSYTPYQPEVEPRESASRLRISNAHHRVDRHGCLERQPLRRRQRRGRGRA